MCGFEFTYWGMAVRLARDERQLDFGSRTFDRGNLVLRKWMGGRTPWSGLGHEISARVVANLPITSSFVRVPLLDEFNLCHCEDSQSELNFTGLSTQPLLLFPHISPFYHPHALTTPIHTHRYSTYSYIPLQLTSSDDLHLLAWLRPHKNYPRSCPTLPQSSPMTRGPNLDVCHIKSPLTYYGPSVSPRKPSFSFSGVSTKSRSPSRRVRVRLPYAQSAC